MSEPSRFCNEIRNVKIDSQADAMAPWSDGFVTSPLKACYVNCASYVESVSVYRKCFVDRSCPFAFDTALPAEMVILHHLLLLKVT